MSRNLRMTESELAARDVRITAIAKVTEGKVGKFKPVILTEHQEQCLVIAWAETHPIAKHIVAVPNGANKSPAAAAKFKREGLRAGYPDLILDYASGGFYGLKIEMKRTKGGVVSPEQKKWEQILLANGYAYYTCRGADAAIKAIREYLGEI